MKPLPENVKALQEICSPFGKAEYDIAYELSCQLSDPIVMEIYQTPEFPNKIAVKVRGYGVSLDFLKRLPDRNYDKEMKRWLIPRTESLVERLVKHYGALPEVTIKNRLSSTKEAKTKPIDFGKRQAYLVSKYPAEMQVVITLYTDTLIRMRYSWKTVMQYTGNFGKYVRFLGSSLVPINAGAKERRLYKCPIYRDSFALQLRCSKPYLAPAKRGFKRLTGKQNSQRSNRTVIKSAFLSP
jgi:hypothetical protein